MFNFALNDGYVLLRIICGLFFIPHLWSKITGREQLRPIYTAMGLKPENAWITFSIACEVILAPCLILGIFTHFAAAIAAIFLLVAALLTFKVSKKWLWPIGGMEYPFFWALCCAIVALNPH